MDKEVDADTHLRALALWTMAKEHYDKCREYEASLSRLFGYPQGEGYLGHFSDELYNANGSFEAAFQREGFVVKKSKQEKAA